MQLAVDELILHELLVVRVKICQQKSQGQASSNNRSEVENGLCLQQKATAVPCRFPEFNQQVDT